MKNKESIVYSVLLLIGILNAMSIVIAAIRGSNEYTIAIGLNKYFNIILLYIPISLLLVTFMWWLIDNIRNSAHKVNYFAIAFCAVLSDTLFVFGTLLFAVNK